MKKIVFSKVLILFIICTFLSLGSTFAVVRDLVESVKVLRVNSISQKIEDFNKVTLEGNVEILIDFKFHIWADEVKINKEEQSVFATAKNGGFLRLQTPDFILLASEIFLDLDKKTGYANNVKIHIDGSFISAQRAEKLNDTVWEISHLLYTACDEPNPHWSFGISQATMHKYFIKGKGLVFRIGGFPVLGLPKIVVPAQSSSKSGFLIPRFTLDKRLGFGINQEYYWGINPHLDTTIGLNWKEKKGYVIYDELRNGRGVDDYSLVKSWIAKENNAYIEKDNKIEKGKDWRFYVEGQHFQSVDVGDLKLNNLINIDFGTDKKIPYDFLGKTDAVEDSFLNCWHGRFPTDLGLFSIKFDRDKIYRSRYFFDSGKTEQSERFAKVLFNHIEWNSLFYPLTKHFDVKHDVFIDSIKSNNKKVEKFYDDDGDEVVAIKELIPLEKSSTFRFYYEGRFQKAVNVKGGLFKLYLSPNLQLRDALKDYEASTIKHNAVEGRFLQEGAYRLFFKTGIECALPEYVAFNSDYKTSYFMQPTFRWDYVPKFNQGHWYYVDQWDRIFPQNSIEFALRNDWNLKNGAIALNLSQGYDFYNKNDLFPLSKPLYQNHLLPFKIDFDVDYDWLHFGLLQEYDIKNFTLIDSELDFAVNLKRFGAYLSWLYQHKSLQKTRDLISDIPSFYLAGISLQANKATSVSYEGQFHSHRNSLTALVCGVEALQHRLKLDWKGHCWKVVLGLHEKRYRQQGVVKRERGIFFSFRLDSFGGIASRFRQEPVIIRKASDF